MRMRWAAVALVLFLPFRALALPEFTFSTNEIPLGAEVVIDISAVSDFKIDAWTGVWNLDPAKIELVSIVPGIATTFVSSAANVFSFNGFNLAGGADTPAVVASVTLKGLMAGGTVDFTSGPIGEAGVGRSDLTSGPFATVVPEPGTFVLLGLALAGLAGLRRRVA